MSEPIDTSVLLTPADFGIPQRRCFTPGELAPFFMCSARTIERLCEEGSIRAIRLGSSWKIPWIEITQFLMRQQGIFN